jgi:hypothetical protein
MQDTARTNILPPFVAASAAMWLWALFSGAPVPATLVGGAAQFSFAASLGFVFGCYCTAEAARMNRSPWWGTVGAFALGGALIVAMLPPVPRDEQTE